MSSTHRDPCLETAFRVPLSPSSSAPLVPSPILSVLHSQVPMSPACPRNMTHIVVGGEVPLTGLDGKGNEADGGGHPHEALQAPSQLPRELDILWGAPWWPQRVGPVPQQQLGSQARRQALGQRGRARRCWGLSSTCTPRRKPPASVSLPQLSLSCSFSSLCVLVPAPCLSLLPSSLPLSVSPHSPFCVSLSCCSLCICLYLFCVAISFHLLPSPSLCLTLSL